MGAKKAVLVGCNYPGTECQLPGCVNDAKNMYFTLISKFGFAEDDITVLIDTASETFGVPTGANIKRALHNMVDSAAPGDVLFFLFSGHGCRVPATAHDDVTGFNECICPTDNNLIHDDDFQELVDKLPPHATFTMVSDSCHSGGLIDKAKEQIGDSFTNREGLKDVGQHAEVDAVGKREAVHEDDAEVEEEQEEEEGTRDYGEEEEEEEEDEEEEEEVEEEEEEGEEEEEEEEPEDAEEEEEKEDGSSSSSSSSSENESSKKARAKTATKSKGRKLKETAKKKESKAATRTVSSKGSTKAAATGAAKGFVKSMPVETLVHNLRTQTGREDVDESNIEEVLYQTFGEESSARVKKDVGAGGQVGGKRRLGEMGVLVSGCQSYQYSRAVPSFDGGYGALTRGLITVLEASQPGITNRELVMKVRRFLASIEFDQLPGLYCSDDLVDAPFLGIRNP